MAQNRLLIKGGKVVNADRSFEADVYCENGIISQVYTFCYTVVSDKALKCEYSLIAIEC